MGEHFLKENVSSGAKNVLLTILLGGFLHGGTNDQFMTRGRESFSNAFLNSLNAVNLKIFAVNGEIYT